MAAIFGEWRRQKKLSQGFILRKQKQKNVPLFIFCVPLVFSDLQIEDTLSGSPCLAQQRKELLP